MAYEEGAQKCVSSTSALGKQQAFIMQVDVNGKPISKAKAVPVCTASCPSDNAYLCANGKEYPMNDWHLAITAYTTADRAQANCGITYPSDQGAGAQPLRPCASQSPSPSSSAAGPFCLPDSDSGVGGEKDFVSAVGKTREGSAVRAVMRALDAAGWVYGVAAILAVILGYAYVKLVQHCALPMALLGMTLIVAGFAGGGFMLLNAGARGRPPPCPARPLRAPLSRRTRVARRPAQWSPATRTSRPARSGSAPTCSLVSPPSSP